MATLIIKSAGFAPSTQRVVMNFKGQDLPFSLPVDWVHARIRKYVGKKLKEVHLDCLIGSEIEYDTATFYQAGETITDKEGKEVTFKKDRMELENAQLVLNMKKVRKGLKEIDGLDKNSDVINKWEGRPATAETAPVAKADLKAKVPTIE